MAWPSEGDGWEPFGTVITSSPETHPLPQPVQGFYYDPSRLNGLGSTQQAITHLFHGSTVVVRRRRSTVEAEFRAVNVWGDALLDQFVVPELGAPCSLVLDIYGDDRATILWSVGTAVDHAHPYMVEPTSYAEQEVDIAAGAASLGTIAVTVIDPTTVAGDQDAGWMTAKLAELGLANLRGRRARLRRFISEEAGFYVLADGPAGTPRLDASYAGFTFDIRDTRETERKIRLFSQGGEQSLVPEGTLEGYGYSPLQGWLIPPMDPIPATVQEVLPGDPSFVYVVNSGPPVQVSLAVMAAAEPLAADFSGEDTPETWVNRTALWFRWRLVGDTAWTEVRELLNAVLMTSIPIPDFDPASGFPPPEGFADVVGIFVGAYEAVGLPADGDSVEWQLIGPRGVPPSEEVPFTIDGLTTGELIRRVYDGAYSVRAVDGSLVPTGIQYDSDALDLMTDPVRIRLTDLVTDARDWLERMIYGPTGWAPALDDLGRVAPVSQVAPENSDGLLVLDNSITEPAPNWHGGERIINVLRFTYLRDYIPPDPDDADADGLAHKTLVVEYRDEVSIDRNGEQVLALDGEAFRAIGDPDADPVSGDFRDELGWQLAQLRQVHVQARYSLGAPVVSVAVMREQSLGLRAGSWVVLYLSWLPDYATQRRGLITLGQVVALGDLDCKWRQVTAEVVVPLLPAS